MYLVALWITMFLPWYTQSPVGTLKKGERAVSSTLTAWGAFSWVEAAVLLICAGVVALMFARGERRGLHLPGGDGFMIMSAGGLAATLIVYGMFERPSVKGTGIAVTSGNDWGIFFALFAAIWLTWTGRSMRSIHRAELAVTEEPPPKPPRQPQREDGDEQAAERVAPVAAAHEPRSSEEADAPRREHRGVTREDAEQLSFELPDERYERR